MPRDPAHESAHPVAGHQLAQAPAPGGAAPIGRVDTLAGAVTAQHVDGTVEPLSQGAAVYQRDLIATAAGAKVALVFADKTTFALGESGQMRLDEMIYDPTHKDGKIALSMLKGAFAFVSGDIASTQADAMTVRTPVGTIGIRGTAVEGRVDITGGSTFSAVPDPSGAHSTVQFTNGAGTEILTDNTSITVQSFFSAPSAPFALAAEAGELSALMAIASAIANSINPGGSTPGGPGGPLGPLPGQGIQGLQNGVPLIHASVIEDIGTGGAITGFTINYTITDVLQNQPPPIPVYLTVPPAPPPDTESNGVVVETVTANDVTIDGGGAHSSLNATAIGIGDVIDYENASALVANFATHTVVHGQFTDTIVGFQGIIGSAFDDFINVSLTGGGHSITVEGGAGNNTLIGASTDSDFVSYAHAPAGVSVDLAAGTADNGYGGTDVISGFNGVIGSAFDDYINVSLTGGGHSITVEGGGGNNTLIGALSDSDWLSYAEAPSGVTVNFNDGSGTANNGLGGNDSFSGFTGVIVDFGTVLVDGSADVITVSGEANTITGADGNDTIHAWGSFDTISVGNGNASIDLAGPAGGAGGVVFAVTTGTGNDTITGSASFDTIVANGNYDVISLSGGLVSITTADGLGGAETISVGLGFDTIAVGSGNDVITALGGAVSVTAGGGNNTINVGGGFDTVTVGNGDDSIMVTGDYGVVTFGSGSDTISVIGSYDLVQDTGQQADSISLGNGGDDTILVGNENVSITVSASHGDYIQVGTGDDTFSFLGGNNSATISVPVGNCGDDAISTSTGDAITFVGSGDFLNLTSTGNGGTVSVVGDGDVIAVEAGQHNIVAGDDSLYLYDAAMSLTGSGDYVTSQNGDDTISVVGNHNQVYWGTGDAISVSGNYETVFGIGGDDTVSVSASVSLSGNDDYIELSSDYANVTLSLTGIDDSISVSATDDHLLLLGSDASVMLTVGNVSETITIGANSDSIDLENVNGIAVPVLLTGSNDLVSFDENVNNPYPFSVDVGGGADTLSFGFGCDSVGVGGSGISLAVGGAYQNDGLFLTITGSNDLVSLSLTQDFIEVTVTGANDAISVSGGADTIEQYNSNESFAAYVGHGDDSIAIYGQDDTLSLPGSNETIAIDIGGGNETTYASGDSILVGGSSDAISVDDSEFSTSFSIAPNVTGTTITVSCCGEDTVTMSSNDSITLYASDDLILIGSTGTGNAITVIGDYNTIALSGSGDTLSAGSGDDTINVSGNGDSIALGFGCNNAITMVGSGDFVTVSVAADRTISVAATGGGDTISAVASSDDIDVVGGAQAFTIDIDGTNDAMYIVGGSDTITVGGDGIGYLDVTGSGVNVIVTALAASSFFDFTGGAGGILTLDLAGTTTETVSGDAGSFELPGTSSGPGVSDLVLENGSYHLTFDGTVLNGGDMTVDASQLAASSTLYLDVSAESGSIQLLAGGGADTLIGGCDGISVPGNNEALTLSISGTDDSITLAGSNDTITLGISSFDNNHVSVTGGSDTISFVTDNDAIYVSGGADVLSFGAGFGCQSIYMTGSGDALTIGGAAQSETMDVSISGGNDTLSVSLNHEGVEVNVTGANDVISISGSDDYVSLYGGAYTVNLGAASTQLISFGSTAAISVDAGQDTIFIGNGNDTIYSESFASGGDTITFGSGTDQIQFTAPLNSFSSAGAAADANTDTIGGFQDTGGNASVIDLTSLSGVSTETFNGLRAGATFAAAFGADLANAVDYAVIGGNTFIHAATSGGGYSAGDLLIELTGAHTLTGANFHLHP